MSSLLDGFRDTLIPSTIANAQRLRFYGELWRHAEPERVRTTGDLPLLPLMDKIDYLERFHLFWTEQLLRRDFLVTHTSGTTGEPVYRYRGQEELAYIYRFFAALQHSRRGSSRDAALVVDTSIPDVGHGGAIRIPTPRTILSMPMKTPTGAERVMEALATPHRVAGTLRFAEGLNMGTRQLVILTSLLAERGIDPQRAFRVRWITTSGGYLNTGALRRISACWGIPVSDKFSLSEIFGGAWKCPSCGWYHPDPFVAPEVVDHRTGVPVGRGSGVLVLTELFPFVQTHPFIRYWTGDVVETAATDCQGASFAFRFLGRTYARCRGRGRAPFEIREKHATQEVLLDEDGSLLVRPVPLLDLLGDEEGIARWPIWADGIDPLGLGRPRFALGFEPDAPSVVRLCVSVDCRRKVDPTLPSRLHASLLRDNPELAVRYARKDLTIDVALVDAGAEPPWADRSRPTDSALSLSMTTKP
jgi:phenylacetate-coenzyme A ligase PaaK-like adenylate-forming protein